MTRATRALSAASGALMLAAALTGCSGAGTPAPTAPSTTAAPATKAPAAIDVSQAPGSGKDFVGAREDATVDDCSVASGTLTAKGSVRNPTKANQDYRIYVSALASGDTKAIVQIDVDGVAPHAVKPWHGSIKVAATTVQCVLRVERTAAH